MKGKSQNSSDNHPGQSWQVNLRDDAEVILKTMLLLGKPYGTGYIARILRGDPTVFSRLRQHEELETFGSMADMAKLQIRLRIQVLLEYEMILPAKEDHSTFKVGPRGIHFLDKPKDLLLDRSRLWLSKKEYYTLVKLFEFRRKYSSDNEVPAYEIFTDYTADRMVQDSPSTLKELLQIPGMTDEKAERYGASIMEIISEMEDGWQEAELENLQQKIQHETHQEVLRLFQADHDIDEISGILGIRPEMVENKLMDFHRVGELDLRSWIESHFESSQFFRLTKYFRRMRNVRLGEACRVLGVEVPLLRLVKFYVNPRNHARIPMQTA